MAEHQGQRDTVPALQRTVLYPLRPRGEGTADVESLYGYLLSLCGEHSLPAGKVLAGLSKSSAWHDLGHSLGRSWDSRHGADMVGVCNVAERWSKLLEAATGVETLKWSTLHGLSNFVCGIGLIAPHPRVCLQCLEADTSAGAMSYERLWWRVAAVTCCPLHRARLVKPNCSEPTLRSSLYVPKRSGVCSTCGSVGYKCHAGSCSDATPSERELWTAEQIRKLVAALPSIAKANHEHMKDEISHYCSNGRGRASVARRANLAKSQMSHWLGRPKAKTSLAVLLDLALVEQFDLTDLLLGKLKKEAIKGSREPIRKKRVSRRVDHEALHWRMKLAVAQRKKASEVAKEAGVDISTVAKHEDFYLELREQTQEELDAVESSRHQKAIEEAETVLQLLVPSGVVPSLRAAGELTGDPWYPAQLRAMSLTALRVMLGDKRVTIPPRMAATSHAYKRALAASSIRLRSDFGMPVT